MPNPSAIVTGAGSGVGRAIALRLSAAGWNVVLVGRRADALSRTTSLARPANGARLLEHPTDIASETSVNAMVERAVKEFGGISVLVNAAGTNAPRRALDVLSVADYREILETNLTGAFLCVRAILPSLRENGGGTIININSDAGLIANPKAGAAYVASKFGLAGLTQSINAEERGRGIRACSIFPGDIDTPLLEKRLVPPPADARTRMLQADDVAACAMLAIELPPRALIEQLVVRPTMS